MKKAIAMLLVIAMTAALAIGGTLAYLTDTDEDVNVMTLGQVKIDQLEYERVDVETEDEDADVQEFHDNKPLLPAVTDKDFTYTPGDSYVDWDQIGKDGYTSDIWDPTKINNEVDKMVFVKNKGDWDAYVRTVFAFEAGSYTTLDEFNAKMHLNLNTTDFTWEWVEAPMTIGEGTYFVAVATYNKVLTPGALTEISLSQIALDKTATNDDVAAFGDTYQVLVQSQAVQAAGFDDPETALNEAFGQIPPKYPFENDSPVKGTDVYTALNYLDGGTQQITKQVSNIIFGLNADYPEIVDANKGTLVDVEQDVPVYAYYVLNGSNYDVYLLASDTIYTPKDCSNLCNGMSALQTVDTSNLDVSRTESMYRMFRDCNALKSIDVSDWDTSNVTNMHDLFRGCKSLPSVDVSNWNTSKVETMVATFQDCVLMKEIDVANWDTSNVTTMVQTFNRCNALTTLDVSKWDTSKVTSMQLMFQECLVLPSLDVSKWDTGEVTSMGGMFRGAYALAQLDVSNWDVSKVSNFSQLFASGHQNRGDMKITTLDVSKWDTSSATNMGSVFYGCGNLTELDLSSWDMSKVTNMSHMFADCFKLQSIDFTGWNTDSLEVMDATFNDCDGLVTLDVSDFDTHNVKEFCQVFDDCENLEQIIGLENWNTANGCTFEEMFQGCDKLTVLDLSSFNTANARDNFKGASDTYHAFVSMFSNTNNLQTLIIGKDFDFNGNSDSNAPVRLPNPGNVDGQSAMWYNAANDTYYNAADIPEPNGVTVTYVAAVPPTNP